MMYSWHVRHTTGESSFLYASDYCLDIFGISAEEAMKNSNLIVNMMIEEDVPGFSAAIVQSMQDLSLFDRQLRIKRTSDGERRTIHFQSRPRRETTGDDGDLVTIWDGVITDVTRHAHHQNFRKRQIESLIQEDSLTPMFALDAQGKVTEWNQLMVKTTGYGHDEVLGKPFIDFVQPFDRTNFSAFASDILEERRQAGQENGIQRSFSFYTESEALKRSPEQNFSFLAADGTNRQLQTTCKVTYNLNGEIDGLVWACQDMTLLQEAQQEKDAAKKLVRAERGLQEAGIVLSLYWRDSEGRPAVPVDAALPYDFPAPRAADQILVDGDEVFALERRPEVAAVELDLRSLQLDQELARNTLREFGYVPKGEVESDGGVRWLRDAFSCD